MLPGLDRSGPRAGHRFAPLPACPTHGRTPRAHRAARCDGPGEQIEEACFHFVICCTTSGSAATNPKRNGPNPLRLDRSPITMVSGGFRGASGGRGSGACSAESCSAGEYPLKSRPPVASIVGADPSDPSADCSSDAAPDDSSDASEPRSDGEKVAAQQGKTATPGDSDRDDG